MIGVLKGMGLTLKEFFSTYPTGRALLRVFGHRGEGLFTVSYPETKQQHAERFRVFPFLVYDGTPDNLRCVACKICEQECPPQCIHIDIAEDAEKRPLTAHGRKYPAKFDIDVSICMSCRICVDVCPFDAIEMDNEYERADLSRAEAMLYDKDKLLKSAEYFAQIKPEESAEVEARLEAKRAKLAAAAQKAAQPKPAPAAPAAPAQVKPPADAGAAETKPQAAPDAKPPEKAKPAEGEQA